MHTEMQSRGAESVRERMERLRGICDREVPIEIHRMDSIAASYCKSLDSIKARAQETVQNRIMLGKMKGRLREADDEFVKVLAVKTRNEAKQMAARDSISAARARIEEVKRTLQLERARRDEYAATLSQQALGNFLLVVHLVITYSYPDFIDKLFKSSWIGLQAPNW
uniref:Uncharacterized protein n=1 Tax=Rhizophora mucronata TaxID=61149 RepID=A0A2P2J9B2_RHIMU